MTPNETARLSDEAILARVRLRAAGVAPSRLARHFGIHRVAITKQTNAVMDADLAESGEDPALVAAAYWGRR